MFQINDVEDIETHLPGLLPGALPCSVYLYSHLGYPAHTHTPMSAALKTWLRLYKSQGGIINEFGFGGNTLNR